MPKRILLTSLGFDEKSASDALVSLFSKSPSEMRAVIVPTAGYPEIDRFWVNENISCLSKLGITNVSVIDLKEESQESLKEKLEDIDLVYVTGGNTFWLLYWANKTGFIEIVTKLIDKSAIYVGLSAGSILASPTIETAGWGDADDASVAELDSLKSLNFVSFDVVVHYDESIARIIAEEAKKTSYPVVTLRDGQAILVKDEEVTFIGEDEPVSFNGFYKLITK